MKLRPLKYSVLCYYRMKLWPMKCSIVCYYRMKLRPMKCSIVCYYRMKLWSVKCSIVCYYRMKLWPLKCSVGCYYRIKLWRLRYSVVITEWNLLYFAGHNSWHNMRPADSRISDAVAWPLDACLCDCCRRELCRRHHLLEPECCQPSLVTCPHPLSPFPSWLLPCGATPPTKGVN